MTDTASPSDGGAAPQATSRDRHLFGPGPKRILALDGGGVRGALTVAFLERIETVLRARHGKTFRLGDYFDLIGGTSTGAIIAGALALGREIADVKQFYLERAHFAFRHQSWRVPVLQPIFDARDLRRQIEDVVGDRELQTPDLITGFALVSKRMDTGSPWIISNNPRAPYWEDAPGHIGNKNYPLVNLVRASTAAPHFFDPEMLSITRRETLPDEMAKPLNYPWPVRALRALLQRAGLQPRHRFDSKTEGLFVDGAVTPHGNPSLALLHLATLKPFGICWPTGPQNLSITSVGTGSHRPRLSFETLGFARFPKLAYHALLSMMNDSETMVLALMQWLGECATPWEINSEVGTLCDSIPPGGKMFRFARYDAKLEEGWLSSKLGRAVSAENLERYRRMDDPTIVGDLYKIGCELAEQQVDPKHWAA